MDDPLAPLIVNLHAEGRPRVWSLVITVFGDMVQHRGGVISTARLGALLARIGVESGAMRTALSRLGRDGWVSSERRGRTSLYRLTAEGMESFAPATARIYAAPRPDRPTAWSLHVQMTGTGPVVGLSPAGQAPDGADCVVTGDLTRISEDWRAQLLPDGQRLALTLLGEDLAALDRADALAPLDAAAARVLLIHRWRRIALRDPDPLPDLLPRALGLGDPRADVAQAYRRLAPLAEAWLDADLGDQGQMPPADARFSRRFA